MNKITVISIVIAVIMLGGIVWIARPDSQTGNTVSLPSSSNLNGTLEAEETNFDFGAISMAAGKISHSFKIKNTGNEPVNVESMYTSCMCTTAAFMMNGPSTDSGQARQFGPYGMPGHGFIPKINEALGAGEEAIVEVVFDPAAHGPAGVGKIERVVYLENDAGSPLELGIQATVTP